MITNKKQLVEELAVLLHMTEAQTERIVNSFINLIYVKLREGGEVNISGFGKFSVSHRQPRTGVNPRNFKPITIPELNTPKFKAGEAFKEAVKLKKN